MQPAVDVGVERALMHIDGVLRVIGVALVGKRQDVADSKRVAPAQPQVGALLHLVHGAGRYFGGIGSKGGDEGLAAVPPAKAVGQVVTANPTVQVHAPPRIARPQRLVDGVGRQKGVPAIVGAPAAHNVEHNPRVGAVFGARIAYKLHAFSIIHLERGQVGRNFIVAHG